MLSRLRMKILRQLDDTSSHRNGIGLVPYGWHVTFRLLWGPGGVTEADNARLSRLRMSCRAVCRGAGG